METRKQTLLLGGHMPLLNDLELTITRGEALGFTVIQLYTRSAQEWVKHEMTAEEINAFRNALKTSTIDYVIALDPYMKHLGLPDLERSELMNELISDELTLCDLLGIPYLILHPGTCSLRSGTLECIIDIAENINKILDKASGNTMILLQNMASGGKSICYTFEHLAQLYRDINRPDRIGICFDMCNAFASGYAFGTKDEYKQMWREFDRIIGLPLLKAIHINDSREDKGSGVSSHAFIGKGRIPYEAYRLIMNDKRFFDVPKIIEIPAQTLDDYKEAYDILVDFLMPSNKLLYGLQ